MKEPIEPLNSAAATAEVKSSDDKDGRAYKLCTALRLKLLRVSQVQ